MATNFERSPTIEGVDLEEGGVTSNSFATGKLPKEAVRRPHHKDGLHRYTTVKDEDKDKDHYLQADDGKLEVLRVQKAPNNNFSNNLKTTWGEPEEVNLIKSLWRGFRNSPRSITT